MKLLGHAWVAVNAHPEGNKGQLVLGSIIPEIVYYTKDHPFKYEEIHEGGDKVFSYVMKHKPEVRDFALGMIAHSNTWGADRFNRKDKLAILGRWPGGNGNQKRNSLSNECQAGKKYRPCTQSTRTSSRTHNHQRK